MNRSTDAAVDEAPADIPPEVMAEMQASIERAMNGERHRAAIRGALLQLGRLREKTYLEHGLLDIGVPAIREFRDVERGTSSIPRSHSSGISASPAATTPTCRASVILAARST